VDQLSQIVFSKDISAYSLQNGVFQHIFTQSQADAAIFTLLEAVIAFVIHVFSGLGRCSNHGGATLAAIGYDLPPIVVPLTELE
jgi:hypothetical protein